MAKNNVKVREAAKSAGVPLWKIAVALGISENTVIRWLRVPLSPDRERKIMDAICSVRKDVS